MKLSRLSALLLGCGLIGTAGLTAQPIVDDEGDVGIGSLTTEPTAVLELVSIDKGFLVPRMTEVQRDGIVAPADALLIFNTTTSEYNYWDPSTGQWEVFITSANIMDYAWVLEGNNLDVAVDPTLQSAYNGATGAFLGTTSADNAVIATTQNQAIDFFTNGTERFSVEGADGDIVPTNDNDIDLGSDANRFAELYVNGSSVHIGPSGGEAGNTEMELGYAGNIGTINVDGGNAEVRVDAGNGVFMVDADASGVAEFFVNGTGGFISTDVNNDGTNEVIIDDVLGIRMDADSDGQLEVRIDGTTLDVDALLDVDGNADGASNLLVDGVTLDVDADGDGAVDAQIGGSATNLNTELFVDADKDLTPNFVVLDNLFWVDANDDGNPEMASAPLGNGVLFDGNSDGAFDLTVWNFTGDVQVSTNLIVDGTSTLTGVVDAQSSGNTVGDGTGATQLTVEGNVDAVGTETLPDGVWDLAVEGDIAASGIIKSGAGVWLDGVSAVHSVTADEPLDVQTLGANPLRLATNGTAAVVVDGGTQNVNILQDADVDGDMNVDGATTLQSTLEVDGITNLNSNLNVDGATDLNATLNVDGAVTINNTIDQVGGGDVTFSGNVDATSGLDVSGQDLTVDASVSIAAPGSGHVFGNGNAVNQVRIAGVADAVPAPAPGFDTYPADLPVWDLAVEGDIVATGIIKSGGSMWIDGRTPGNHSIVSNDNLRIEVLGSLNQLEIVAPGGISYETDGNYIFTGDQATPGTGVQPVPLPEHHVVIVENTNVGNGNGNGMAIVIEDNVSAFNNNYISFYRGQTTADMAGRIEGFSRQNYLDLANEVTSTVTNPGIYNPFNYIDFDFPITYNSDFISFSGGSLPSLSGGSLPSLSIDWGSFDFSFSPGSLPSLNTGSLPSISFSEPFTFGTPSFGFNFTGSNTLTGEILSMSNPGIAWEIYGDPIGAAINFAPFLQSTFKGGVTYQSGAGDYAEWLERENHDEDIRIGEVVGVRGGKISKRTEGADQLMVVSWKPAVLGNMPDAGEEQNYEKIAFMGQIPVKVLGNVNVGDYLVPSGLDDGLARAIAPEEMTADFAGQVLGVAWTSATGNGVNLVKAGVGLKPHEYMQVIRNQEDRIDELEERLRRLEQQMNGTRG